MLREWNKKGGPVTLVDTWNILYRDARIISLFGIVVSSNRVLSAQSIPCMAEDVIGSLMLLAQESNNPIKMVINNTGGDVNDGFAINHAMEHVKAKGIEIWTINICQSASMATMLLMMGTRNRRYVLNNTITHLHSGTKAFGGKDEDVDGLYEFSRKHFKNTLTKWLLENTQIPEYWNKVSGAQYTSEQLFMVDIRLKLIKDFMSGERYLVANEAVEAGVADKVLMPGDPIIDEIFRVESIKGGQNV